MKMTSVKIVRTGMYLPSRIVTNQDIHDKLVYPWSPENIERSTGIHTRRFKGQNDTLASMGLEAVRTALQDVDTLPDALIYVQNMPTPYHLYPVGGELHHILIQNKLITRGSSYYTIAGGCAEWCEALQVAYALITARIHERVLCVTSTTASEFIDWKDRETAMLFGDGACAALLEVTSEAGGFQKFYGEADGSGYREIYLSLLEKDIKITMPNGDRVFHYAVRATERAVTDLTRDSGKEKIEYFIFHQANGRILDRISKTLNIPPEKDVRSVQQLGNTDTASIGITLDLLLKGKEDLLDRTYNSPKKGDYIVMIGFGAGLKTRGALYQV